MFIMPFYRYTDQNMTMITMIAMIAKCHRNLCYGIVQMFAHFLTVRDTFRPAHYVRHQNNTGR